MTNERLNELISIQNRINHMKSIVKMLETKKSIVLGFLPEISCDENFIKYFVPEKEMVDVIKDYFGKELNRLTKEFEEA